MRNLKKILALVLACVMSLSLMTMAGAADWSDVAADTSYGTAIDVLTALEVIHGYDDGTFRPDGLLSRAEAAVFVYRVATGDAADKYKDNYTDMTIPFTDLDNGYTWAKPYINYCQNAGIIIGTSATTFSPSQYVTGYQLMVMVLRILGYGKAGEFAAGSINWELESASRCESLGMLKNIPGTGDFGKPAPRGMTAEILFRGLLQEKVDYSIATPGGYTKTGVTLGKEQFGLEEVKGVLVANEYADIRRDEKTNKGNSSPESAGISVLRDSTGKDYRINETSKLEALGETHIVYTIPKDNIRDTYDKKCVAMEKVYDGAEVVFEDGVALTTSEFNSKAGNIDKDAKRYINFGEETLADDTAKIKVTYEVKEIVEEITARTATQALATFINKYNLSTTTVPAPDVKVIDTVGTSHVVRWVVAATDRFANGSSVWSSAGHVYSIGTKTRANDTFAAGDAVYRVEIEPEATYTSADEAMVKAIFYTASTTTAAGSANGNVTTAAAVRIALNGLLVTGAVYRGTQDVTDYSNRETYETFLSNFINTPTVYDDATVNSNQRGWWLKIIDNDKDGYVDYVFQTRYTVALVTAVADDGKLTLDTWNVDSNHLSPDLVNQTGTGNPGISGVINYNGDTIEKGDAVYYAKIDGKYYAWKCDEVYGTVTSVTRSTDDPVITLNDGSTYHQSAVHEHSRSDSIWSGFASITGTVEMTLYMDKYGYVAAYTQNHTGKLVLLTDGWAQTLKNGTEYAVLAYDNDAGDVVQHDVVNGGSLFIDGRGSNWYDYNSVNSWNRVLPFAALNCIDDNWNQIRHLPGTDNYYYEITADTTTFTGNIAKDAGLNARFRTSANVGLWDDIHTIVAYMDDVDGTGSRLIPVDRVYDVKGRNGHDYQMIDVLAANTIPSNVVTRGRIYSSGATAAYTRANAATVDVRATSTTQYYFVYQGIGNNANGLKVHAETGYANAGTWAANNYLVANKYIENVYVVGTKADNAATNTRDYYTADVVVVELNNNFNAGNQVTRRTALINKRVETQWWNGYNLYEVIWTDTGVKENIWLDDTVNIGLGLYQLDRTLRKVDGAEIYQLVAEISANSQYAVGTVTVGYAQDGTNDYAVVDRWYDNGVEPVPSWRNTFGEQLSRGNVTSRHASASKYYTASYDDATGRLVIEEAAGPADVLYFDEHANDYNYVLVCYTTTVADTAAAGTIRYAITFEDAESVAIYWSYLVPTAY